MLVLGIETSCDETSSSIVNKNKILSNVVSSQIKIHKRFGGVVPELASRNHILKIIPTLQSCLSKAKLKLDEIDGISVTAGPGLIGSLVVGINAAKTLAYSINKPFIGINHIHAHLTTSFLEKRLTFPYIGFIISGGHTALYLCKNFFDFELLGETRDDAAGEAFDKIAKYMGLGYPGGIVIDKLAKKGNAGYIRFPRPMMNSKNLDFSFSGLKTSVCYYLKKHEIKKKDIPDIVASAETAIVDTLIFKLRAAVKETGISLISVSGGVACNSRLREELKLLAKEENLQIHIPKPHLCTDNAAMVAHLGYRYLKAGKKSDFDLDGFTSL